MLISVFSPKGGVGVTTCAALFAKALSKDHSTMLVETCKGDLEAMLALENIANYGFLDWAVSENPRVETLEKISNFFDNQLSLVVGEIPKKSKSDEYNEHQTEFIQNSDFNFSPIVASLASVEGHCVVDCSNGTTRLQRKIIEASDVVVMVLRQCYTGLYRATQSELIDQVDAVLVVQESGRSISSNQIAQTLSCGVLLEIEARRDFARAIDSGTLWSRTPEKLIGPIEQFVGDLIEKQKPATLVGEDVLQDTANRNQFEFWNEASKNRSSAKMTQASSRFGEHTRRLLNQDPNR